MGAVVAAGDTFPRATDDSKLPEGPGAVPAASGAGSAGGWPAPAQPDPSDTRRRALKRRYRWPKFTLRLSCGLGERAGPCDLKGLLYLSPDTESKDVDAGHRLRCEANVTMTLIAFAAALREFRGTPPPC